MMLLTCLVLNKNLNQNPIDWRSILLASKSNVLTFWVESLIWLPGFCYETLSIYSMQIFPLILSWNDALYVRQSSESKSNWRDRFYWYQSPMFWSGVIDLLCHLISWSLTPLNWWKKLYPQAQMVYNDNTMKQKLIEVKSSYILRTNVLKILVV